MKNQDSNSNNEIRDDSKKTIGDEISSNILYDNSYKENKNNKIEKNK